jgi:hypothetical protein
MEHGEAVPGVAVVPAGPEGILAGFSLHAVQAGGVTRLAYALIWIDAEGHWTEEEETVAARLSAAAGAAAAAPHAARLGSALALLAGPVRARLATARERRWAGAGATAPARVVAGGLQEAVRAAARRRDTHELERLERALAFVGGGHTAGEAMLLERLAQRSAVEIARGCGKLPAPTPRWGPVEARFEGLLLFVPEGSVPGPATGGGLAAGRTFAAAELEVLRIEDAGNQGEVRLALPEHPRDEMLREGPRGEPDVRFHPGIAPGKLWAEPGFADRMPGGHREGS